MRLTHPRNLARTIALSTVAVLLLLCLAAALLVSGAAGPAALELPVWFGTTLLVKSGPQASCPTQFMCLAMSSLPRPGVSLWLISRAPDGRETGWRRLLFLPAD